jgi:hypothetical protein
MIDRRVIYINRLKGSQSGNHPYDPTKLKRSTRSGPVTPIAILCLSTSAASL